MRHRVESVYVQYILTWMQNACITQAYAQVANYDCHQRDLRRIRVFSTQAKTAYCQTQLIPQLWMLPYSATYVSWLCVDLLKHIPSATEAHPAQAALPKQMRPRSRLSRCIAV